MAAVRSDDRDLSPDAFDQSPVLARSDLGFTTVPLVPTRLVILVLRALFLACCATQKRVCVGQQIRPPCFSSGRRVPQDGAIALRTENRRVDMRVNTCPTVHGEKVVMRVLDKDAIPLELSGLGFDERQEKDLSESIKMPHGLMLVTGPTGSGKSTTLYGCLNYLNSPEVNICTAQDPVEYKFTGINQVHMRSKVGLDFASTLRSFLRQDPDIIMVGEVRDGETAKSVCVPR